MKNSRFLDTNFLLPLAAGILSGACQLYGGLGILIIFTLVPFFSAILRAGTLKAYSKAAAIFALSYYCVQFSFLYTVKELIPFGEIANFLLGILTVILLTVWESLWFFLCVLWGYFFKKKLSRGLAASLLFVLCEHLQETNFIFPFGWSKLENSIAFFPELIQPASLFGGSFVAFILLTTTTFITLAADMNSSRRMRILSVFAAFLTVFSTVSFSNARIHLYRSDGGEIGTASIQTAVYGAEKYELTTAEAVSDCKRLISQYTDPAPMRIDLILLPETAIPEYTDKTRVFSEILNLSEKSGRVIVTGCFSKDKDSCYNSLIAALPDGRLSDTSNKSFLVPFGEYAPFFKDRFNFKNLTPSKENQLLKTPVGDFGGIICIESIFSEKARQLCRDGASVLLVSTNDSWFFDTRGRNMHFANCILRATENNRYLIRSGNCGISAVISPLGKVLSADFSQNEGAVIRKVYKNSAPSLYTVLGDVIILPAAIVLTAGVIKASFSYRKNEKNRKNRIFLTQ